MKGISSWASLFNRKRDQPFNIISTYCIITYGVKVPHVPALQRQSFAFLEQLYEPGRPRAASILGHYLGNVRKVVPQNTHFNLDL